MMAGNPSYYMLSHYLPSIKYDLAGYCLLPGTLNWIFKRFYQIIRIQWFFQNTIDQMMRITTA